MKRISVLLVEDHTVVREGIRGLLELEADLEVVGEAQDGRHGVSMAGELRPDVVLMDIAMPRMNGLEATRQIHDSVPEARILVLSAHEDEAYVRGAIEAGAAGFLLKEASARDLCRAIREVHRGGNFCSSPVSKRLRHLRRMSEGRASRSRGKATALTSRETEVLQLVAEGRTNKETAAELGISIKTVEKHRTRLMEKLDIHDTAGLTRHAIAAGVIEGSVRLTIV